MRYTVHWALIGVALFASETARADVVQFTDRDAWFAAVGAVTTIDFTGFPEGTLITQQYANLSVNFTDGDDFISLNGTSFPNDGSGLNGGDFFINITFLTPQAYFAVEFPTFLYLKLFNQGTMLYSSGLLGGPGLANFAGPRLQ